jgi:hypothetical protein
MKRQYTGKDRIGIEFISMKTRKIGGRWDDKRNVGNISNYYSY